MQSLIQKLTNFRSAIVIVAHPCEETLWAGGTMLMHPEIKWTVVSLYKSKDSGMAEKFLSALKVLNAQGHFGEVDEAIGERGIQKRLLEVLPLGKFDLAITHNMWGEYKGAIGHEAAAKTVLSLRRTKELAADEMWMFAYDDGGGKKVAGPAKNADLSLKLTDDIWQKKYDIITKIYGFGAESLEVKMAAKQEAFWVFGAGQK